MFSDRIKLQLDGNKLLHHLDTVEKWIDGRLIRSPHAAFYSVPGQRDLRRKAIETVVSYLRDGTLRNCVNLEYLAKRNA